MKSKIFIICLLGLLIFPLNVFAKTYPVIWNPEKVEEIIGLGGTKDLTVTFESSISLENVNLWIVPELQPFVSIEPTRFETIEATRPYQIRVHLSVPYDTQTGFYDGTIHLKVGSKTYPQTLKIKLNAVDLMTGAIPPPDTIPETATIQYITEDGELVDIEIIKGQVIVLFDSSVSESTAETLIISNGGDIIAKIPSIKYYLVGVTLGDEMNFIGKMRQDPTVIFAIPNIPLEPLQVEPNEWKDKDFYFSWHLKEINAPLAWELVSGLALSEKKIAIIDEFKGGGFNGFNAGLKDFEGRIVGTVPAQLPWPLPSEGHGTKVTAIAAAMGNHDFGNVGVNWKSKISLEVVYSPFDAIYDILDNISEGADVINLSLGLPGCFLIQEFYLDPLFAVVNAAKILFPNKKFLVVQAAGNNGCELMSYFKPSYNPKPDNLILVGATMYGGYKWSDSNFGSLIDIAAPGAFSIFYYSTGEINVEAGTSFSTPLVTGAAALVWAKEPNLTPQEVIQRLKTTAKGKGSIPEFGDAGVLDVYGALALSPPPPPSPPPPAGWLSFIEGNPGIPGDGMLITRYGGLDPYYFELATPISLGGFTNGLTITVFVPSYCQNINIGWEVSTMLPEPCVQGFGGAVGVIAPTTVFNGVKGYFTNLEQPMIDDMVELVNEEYPDYCPYTITVDQLLLIGIRIYDATSGNYCDNLDAATILPGQNAVP